MHWEVLQIAFIATEKRTYVLFFLDVCFKSYRNTQQSGETILYLQSWYQEKTCLKTPKGEQ